MTCILVQGIRTETRHQLLNVSKLQSESGRPIEVVLNPTQGIGRDLFNASLGVVRHSWGVSAEKKSVRNLCSKILTNLRQDKKVVLCVYSQGSVIAKDALDIARRVILRKHGEDEWKQRASKISIVAVGAANHLWREEISSVLSLKVPNDPVATFTAPIGRLLSLFKSKDYIFVAPSLVEPVDPELRPSRHSFAHYLGTLSSLMRMQHFKY